jgi:hypothetical protein
MIKKKTASRRLSIALGIAALLGVATTSTSAFAAFVDAAGGLQQVEYPGLLMIQFNGINYQTTSVALCSGAIPAAPMDEVKIWQALAQGSLLAGKSMRIYFNDCNGIHYISDLVLQK